MRRTLPEGPLDVVARARDPNFDLEVHVVRGPSRSRAVRHADLLGRVLERTTGTDEGGEALACRGVVHLLLLGVWTTRSARSRCGNWPTLDA